MAISGGWGAFGVTNLRSIIPTVLVHIKQYWDDDWIWVRDLYCDEAKWVASPGVSEAKFYYDYGTIKRHDLSDQAFYNFVNLNGWYVGISMYDFYGDQILWVGVFDMEEDKVQGSTAPGGRQTMQAYGLEHLLDRDKIFGSYVDDVGTGFPGFIDNTMAFNRRSTFGNSIIGNRSDTYDVNGVYYFGKDGREWSNFQVADQLLAFHTNYLSGDTELLTALFEIHSLEGMTIRQALNKLIDRRRGVGWTIVTDGVGDVYIYVFSLFAIPLVINDTYIPANSEQRVWDVSSERLLEAKYRISANDRWDVIHVQGGPVRMCCTLSFNDETLEEGWSIDEKNIYSAGSEKVDADANDHDIARKNDYLANVFAKFRVPDDWDWYAGDGEGGTLWNIAPFVEDDGFVNFDIDGTVMQWQKVFGRSLPILEDTDITGAEPEYRRPFAIIQDENGDWQYADKLQIDGEDKPLSFRLSDKELACWVIGSINHLTALNHFKATPTDISDSTDASPIVVNTTEDHDLETGDEVVIADHEVNVAANGTWEVVVLSNVAFYLVDSTGSGAGAGTNTGTVTQAEPSNIEPVVDYANLAITVMIKTDSFLHVKEFIGAGTGDGTKTNVISVPDAEYWEISPGTIIDVEDGAAVEESTAVTVRDDTDRLREIARATSGWYSVEKNTISLDITGLITDSPVGSMISQAYGAFHYINLNTVVTQYTWDFKNAKTQIVTGSDEILFDKVVSR
jgi:hypothetical protein